MQWIKGSSPISFPGIGLTIDPPQGFSVGSFTIMFYAIIIAIGMMLAVVYSWKRSKQFGIKDGMLTDGFLMIVPFAVLCARLFYVIFEWDKYADNPISMLYIWEGGLAIYGGIIGAAIGVVVYALVRKIKLPALLDMVALGFLIGQCLGRWGNFFNREAFGAQTDAFLRMGLKLNTEGGMISNFQYYHPTFLYESLWNFCGFILLHNLSHRRQYDGQIALGYALWYGFGRTLIEGLRTDSLYWGPVRFNQLLSAVVCLGAAVTLVVMAFRQHDPQNLLVNQVAAKEAAAEAEQEQTAEEETEE